MRDFGQLIRTLARLICDTNSWRNRKRIGQIPVFFDHREGGGVRILHNIVGLFLLCGRKLLHHLGGLIHRNDRDILASFQFSFIVKWKRHRSSFLYIDRNRLLFRNNRLAAILHGLCFMHFGFLVWNRLCFRFGGMCFLNHIYWSSFKNIFFLRKHRIICLIIRSGSAAIMNERGCFQFDLLCSDTYFFACCTDNSPCHICTFLRLFFGFHIAGGK